MITKKNLKTENEELKATIRDLQERNDFLRDNNDSFKRDSADLCNRLNVLGEKLEQFENDTLNQKKEIDRLKNEIKELTKYKNMYDAEENIVRDVISSVYKNSNAFNYSLNDLFNGDVLGTLDRILGSYKK